MTDAAFGRLDIIIPVYRGEKAVRRCLDSVLASDAMELADVVIINDASPEPDITAFLDDVAAHLDVDRRSALFEAVGLLGGQCWYSGSDEQQFGDLRGKAQFVSVRPVSRSDQTPGFEVK